MKNKTWYILGALALVYFLFPRKSNAGTVGTGTAETGDAGIVFNPWGTSSGSIPPAGTTDRLNLK